MTDILDLIDGALQDWSTSGDAMRWSPEPPGEAPAMFVRSDASPLAWTTADTIRHVGGYRYESGGCEVGEPSWPSVRITYLWSDSQAITRGPMEMRTWDEVALAGLLHGNYYLTLPASARRRPARVSRMHRLYSARLRSRRRRRRG